MRGNLSETGRLLRFARNDNLYRWMWNITKMETINIRYLFKLPDNQQEIIDLHLDPVTLDLMNDLPKAVPFWAKLDFCRCPNCLLDVQNNPNCPIAVHLEN